MLISILKNMFSGLGITNPNEIMLPKKMWVNRIIGSLKQLASHEFQEKGWVKGEVHDYCSFAETIAQLYDDSSFEDFVVKYAKKFNFSKQQVENLDKLRVALDTYIDKHGCYGDPVSMLQDSEWHKIQKLAKDCLEVLNVGPFLDPSKAIPKNSLLHLISYLESYKFLERIWIKERRPNSNPFREWMNKFFYGHAYRTKEIIERYREYDISEDQLQHLVKLFDSLNKYWEKMKNEENLQRILDDPEWHQIQSLAKKVIEVFQWKVDED